MKLIDKLVGYKIKKEVDKLCENDYKLLSSSPPNNYLANLKINKIAQAVKFDNPIRRLCWCGLSLLISIGVLIGLIFFIAFVFTSNQVETFEDGLILIILPYISIPSLIMLAIIVGCPICVFKNVLEVTVPTQEEIKDITATVYSDYFELPKHKCTEDKFISALMGYTRQALEIGITFGKEKAGQEFFDYLYKLAIEDKEKREKERKRLEKLKKKNPIMYQIESIGTDWECVNGNPVFDTLPEKPVVQETKVIEKEIVKEVIKEVVKEVPQKQEIKRNKGIHGGGIHGDMIMCLNCANTSCGRITCPGFVPKRN